MGIQKETVPHYNGSLVIEGNAYKISVRIAKGTRAAEDVPVHSHSQYELLAFCDGSTYIQTGSQGQLMQGGQCCLLQPNAYHLRRCSADTTKYYAMFIKFMDDSPLAAMKKSCLQLQCAPQVLSWFSMLEKERCCYGFGAGSNIQALASLILVAVLREVAGKQNGRESDVNNDQTCYVDVIDDYIALHYTEELRIGELAEQLGITSRHVARIMQHNYGCTFRQRLLEIRLYHAREYLTTTQLPISQIAIRCGFTAESAFSAAFRKNIGCTPSEYRREHQGIQKACRP